MARFFLDLETVPPDKQVIISTEDAAHITKALRLQAEDEIEVVIAGQAYAARLQQVAPAQVLATVLAPLPESSESPIRLYLYQGLPKGDKLELVIQKATELGVTGITPVLTERVVVKLKPEAAAKKVQRWQRIALEAAKQSKRQLVPLVEAPLLLSQLPPVPPGQLGIVAWENDTVALRPLLQRQDDLEEIHVLIGPEGGLTAAEVEFLQRQGWQSVSLGPRILRTETAPLAILTVIQYELGDLGGSS